MGSASSNIPLILPVFARLKQRHLVARRAVVDRLWLRWALSGQRLVMDGHADHKGARTSEDQKGRLRRDELTIRGTLLWTHARMVKITIGL